MDEAHVKDLPEEIPMLPAKGNDPVREYRPDQMSRLPGPGNTMPPLVPVGAVATICQPREEENEEEEFHTVKRGGIYKAQNSPDAAQQYTGQHSNTRNGAAKSKKAGTNSLGQY